MIDESHYSDRFEILHLEVFCTTVLESTEYLKQFWMYVIIHRSFGSFWKQNGRQIDSVPVTAILTLPVHLRLYKYN